MNKHEIPAGLSLMLRDFTVAVLRQKPSDLYLFAADYFQKLSERNRNNNIPSNTNNNCNEDLPAKMERINFGRRRSVAAERYDPEEDEDDDNDDANKKVMHPKTDEQRKRLKEAVQGILLFRSLAPEQMNDVIDAMFERNVDPGDHVIEQGDDGDNFYVIDCGVYDVYVKNEVSRSLLHSGSFGELALMYNMPRSATVVAVTKGRLWAMDRKSFRRIVLRSACKQRKTYESLLEKVPMLQHLDLYERMNLADALTPVYVNDGEMIIKEGDVADGMYFIEHGEVKVTITRNGVECEAARMQAGDYFGEMALVEKAPRSASVYSSGGGTTKLAFLEVDCFERLLGPCLEIMKRNITNYVKSS
ncbi:hypothetical protein HELRODRAFT_108467 [Helobdella robusta]|uniref:cAMP-dependent protein kinase type II regulatory subunit n=1 Tax=Helobdella robusta TaxID=6412 RepID=T1EEJ4_HELRO|nr:hypothetical protein HELRODRAFT_108467 [Helobdella robusta]ESN91712.1 hypothetical protein HELRODRAFT_108467 [Helobdella robusta]